MPHHESLAPLEGAEGAPRVSPETPVAQEPPFEYKLLTGHRRTDGSWKSSDELRTEYLTQTDELIRKAVEGVEYTDPATGEVKVERPDAIVWLDKSARPVSWIMNEMWQKFAADAEGNVPQRPDFYYANIDREQWVNTLDPQGVGTVDITKVDRSVIRSLRSIFVSPANKREGLTEDIDTAPATLDGKNILIVDEVNSTGRTLVYAKKFFAEAFPTAKIAGTYWMGGVAQKGNGVGNADLPVWYKAQDPNRRPDHTGRGVDNRDERRSQQSPSRTQRLGAWFLSTPFPNPDPKSKQLRTEIRHLVHDTEVLIAPSIKRDEDDFDERVARFNKGMTIKQFGAARRKLRAHK